MVGEGGDSLAATTGSVGRAGDCPADHNEAVCASA